MGESRNIEAFIYSFSVLSAVSALIVIFVIGFSQELRSKTSCRLVLYVAISDFMTCCSGFSGLPHDGTSACWSQAILSNVFPLSSIFWTTVMAYVLYLVVATSQELNVFNYKLYGLCWGVPVFLTFLPLTTNTYGTIDSSTGWCFLDKKSGTPSWATQFWVIISFYMWIWIALVIYSILFFYIISSASLKSAEMGSMVHKAINKLIWFPAIVVLCWIFPTIYDIYETFDSSNAFINDPVCEHLDLLTPLLQGFFKMIAFFYSNPDARAVVLKQLQLNKSNMDTTVNQSQRQMSSTNNPFHVYHFDGEEFEDPNRMSVSYAHSFSGSSSNLSKINLNLKFGEPLMSNL
jgi:hypothetical protein